MEALFATVPADKAAIERVVSDPTMRERAETLGRAIRAENGVQTAIAIIRQYLGV